jgi:hypothetical protein
MRLPNGDAAASPNPPRQFGRSQPAGQLQQRERVTADFSDDPVTHLLGISSRSQLDRVGLPDRQHPGGAR